MSFTNVDLNLDSAKRKGKSYLSGVCRDFTNAAGKCWEKVYR